MARRATPRGRGRLSSIEMLPPEAAHIVADAAQALAGRERPQTEIYAEFVAACERLMAEHRGELEFAIPSFSSFNRYSLQQAALGRRLEEARQMSRTLADRFDARGSDDLTRIAGEAIKTLVVELLQSSGAAGVAPLEAMQLAAALKSAAQAQGISTERKRKMDAEFAGQVEEAVTMVAKSKGISAETAEAIKSQILGVAS